MDHFCSQCGTALEQQLIGGRSRPACPACGHVVWSHFSLGVGGLLVHEGRGLCVQRNIEPGRGNWTLPGGYVETGETLDEAIIREYSEETGLHVHPTGLLAIWQTPGGEINNSWCVFALQLVGPLSDLNPDPVEVQAARFFAPQELDGLENIGRWSRWMAQHYAFESTHLCRQEIDGSLSPYLSNPRIALFCAPPGILPGYPPGAWPRA